MKWLCGLALAVCGEMISRQSGVMENLVSVYINGKFQAGGALYRHDLVISTGTHTEFHTSLVRVALYAGTQLEARDRQLFHVTGVYRHPLYNNTNRYSYNVALIKLKVSAETPEKLGCKLDDNTVQRSQFVLVGWGYAKDGWGWPVETLRILPLPFINDTLCSRLMGTTIHPTEICAGQQRDNSDAALVAVGSPLFALEFGDPLLIGLHSRVGESAVTENDHSPVAFVRIGVVETWIRVMAACLRDGSNIRCPSVGMPVASKPREGVTVVAKGKGVFNWLLQ